MTNTIDYLINILTKLSDRCKNSKFILCGDFIHLSMEAVSEAFRLWKLVDFATRQNACLNNIYSDISEYNKQTVQQLSPLIGNEDDHCCIRYHHAIRTNTSIRISESRNTLIISRPEYLNNYIIKIGLKIQ